MIELLAGDDRKLHARVEKALLRAGQSARDWLVTQLTGIAPPARGRAVRALARFCEPGGDGSLIDTFEGLANDADARTRRAALSALGRFSGERAESILLAAWQQSDDLPSRGAIAESLGKAGGERARSLLSSWKVDDAERSRIRDEALLRLSRATSRGGASRIDAARAPKAPLSMRLNCRAGIEEILQGECPREWRARLRGPGLVDATLAAPLETVFTVRTAVGFGFPVPVAAASDSIESLAATITSELATSIIDTFTQGTVRYRLDFAAGGKHRGLVYRLADAIAAHRPAWVNDPSERCWEVAIFEHTENEKSRFTGVELRPRLPDPRFHWRAADVPAASHPTLAAALARVAGVKDDDVVWDPFVGSAGELIERVRLGPYQKAFGHDIDAGALGAARQNLAKAGVASVELRQASAFDAAPPGVTLIITNPPMGRRVHRQSDLRIELDRFVEHAARSLVPGGRLVWISPHGARTAETAKRVGLKVELRRQVDMGGFPAELQAMRRAKR